MHSAEIDSSNLNTSQLSFNLVMTPPPHTTFYHDPISTLHPSTSGHPKMLVEHVGSESERDIYAEKEGERLCPSALDYRFNTLLWGEDNTQRSNEDMAPILLHCYIYARSTMSGVQLRK